MVKYPVTGFDRMAYDIAVIGGGHNGLVAACYLAKAGLKVIVLERRHIVGGCVVSEELFPGYTINVYGFEHYLIHLTPIISDLELARFGLEYYSVDPVMFSPFPDGKYMLFYRDLKKTVKFIEKFSSHDAKAYEEFAGYWSEVNQLLGAASLAPPVSLSTLVSMMSGPEAEEVIRSILLSVRQLLDETFETEYVKAPIAFLGPAAVGVSPSTKGTGWMAGWHLGATNIMRPKGGSGKLTQALAACFKSLGGTIINNASVKSILVRDNQVKGVELEDGKRIETTIVVSNVDPKTTLLKMVGESNLDDETRRKANRIRVANGIAMKADFALNELPDYKCLPGKNIGPCHTAAIYIAPSLDYIENAYSEYESGVPPKEPALMVATHSATDSTLAPPGKHTLVLETRYTPYDLSTNENWDDIKEREAQKLVDVFAEYAPNVRSAITASYVESPVDWERKVGMPRGNFLQCDMTLDQMFAFRPFIGGSGYRMPIKGLYLCGSGTHPGGGISGAPGYNAARVVLADFGKVT
ncbi:MAG: phytoene desaturase family protein [Candidatus Bathyarchaeia archaeon]